MTGHNANHASADLGPRSMKTRDFDADNSLTDARRQAIAGAMVTLTPVPAVDWPLNLFLDADQTDGEAVGNPTVILVFGIPDRGTINTPRHKILGIARSGITQ